MNRAFSYLWRHPRRTGFIAFNILALIAFVAWGAFTAQTREDGVAGLPNLMLGYTGMALLVAIWIAAWLAWAYFVASQQLRRKLHAESVARTAT